MVIESESIQTLTRYFLCDIHFALQKKKAKCQASTILTTEETIYCSYVALFYC